MPTSKIECFINDTKKVFHLQICNSLLIHKGHNPWHTLYKLMSAAQPISGQHVQKESNCQD